MNKHTDYIERVVYLVGFIFLVIASITGIVLDGDPLSIINYVAPSSIVIPAVHIFCASLTLVIIFTHVEALFIAVVMIESLLLVLTNNSMLGIFFFYAVILFIVCKGLYQKQQKKLIIIFSILHCISLAGPFTRGWQCGLINVGYSLFSMSFYVWIYFILKARFSCFLPINVTNNQTINNKKPGEVLSLSDYNLSERQISFIFANIRDNLSYKEISEKYYVSISTVKKEFAGIYKIFNVSKLEELRILLLQYQLKE